MSELQWRAVTSGGEQSSKAPFAPGCGALRLHPELPAGALQTVTAAMPWPMDEDEKLFMNGYQTWTECPELPKWGKQRGVGHVPKALLEKYKFDRYGDYHFVPYGKRKGQSHGFSYCYFRKGERFRLVASLDEAPGYTIFFYDATKAELRAERDCAGVEHPGGAYAALDLFFAEGTEAEVFDAWFAAMGCKPRTTAKLAGYSSWYNRYENIDEASILKDLAGCQTLLGPGALFQIDDGWEPAVGDWLEPDAVKFPGGMRALADAAHAAGLQAGLWLAPFVCETESAIYREHPDWLLKENGAPWCCGGNWSGFYALDIDHPGVQEYLTKVFRRVFDEWGFDLVKLDFLYGAAPVGNARESRGGRMVRAMRWLRELCGDKLILGCGVPVWPAFGLVDYCRVSCDVSLDWDDVWYMRLFHRERISTKQALQNTIFRRQLNGRAYGSDPDVFFLREENCKLTPEQKQTLATVNALFGQILLTSDDPAKYTAAARTAYAQVQHTFADAANVRVKADHGVTVQYALDGQQHSVKVL